LARHYKWRFFYTIYLLHSEGVGNQKAGRKFFHEGPLHGLEKYIGIVDTECGKELLMAGLSQNTSYLKKICNEEKSLITHYVLFVDEKRKRHKTFFGNALQ
jgi:hypothetical protein